MYHPNIYNELVQGLSCAFSLSHLVKVNNFSVPPKSVLHGLIQFLISMVSRIPPCHYDLLYLCKSPFMTTQAYVKIPSNAITDVDNLYLIA